MKALTIHQPYAALIALPDDDDRAKRIENRRWSTTYRGLLAIHAGKSLEWLDLDVDDADLDSYGLRISAMPFGAIVAVANLSGCFRLEGNGWVPGWAARCWPWVRGHRHVEGPCCWVLTEVRALAQPVKCNGRQSLWDVPPDVLEKVKTQLEHPA